jgi:hypothetical protein
MKKILLAASIALIAASGTAFAQPSEGQAGAQAGVNGNAPNSPNSTMQEDVWPPPGVTTGMGPGPGVVVEPPPMQEGPVWEAPIKSPDDGESSQGNVGPGTGYWRR